MKRPATGWKRRTVRTVLYTSIPCALLTLALSARGSGLRLEASASAPEAGVLLASEPELRIGLLVDVDSVKLSSRGGLIVHDPASDREIGRLAPDESLDLWASGGRLAFGPDSLARIRVTAASSELPLLVDGKPYRGGVEVTAGVPGTVRVINLIPLEDYVLGVVPIEIGPRTAEEFAAVQAQAVAARTYALSHLGAREDLGFDMFGSVEDQAYGGFEAERPEATRAVRTTRGWVLTQDRRPIRAFYHSTCGGRTAPVEEVLNRPSAPYLQPISDRAPDGTDYCAISPRYRWQAEWSLDELNRIVRPRLAEYFAVDVGQIPEITGLEVRLRTSTGRVAALAFVGAGFDAELERLDIRLVLRDDGDRILNSTDFDIVDGDDPAHVLLHGRGYGHGAGMCQWGAIGRARAGHDYARILSAYYTGAELTRAY